MRFLWMLPVVAALGYGDIALTTTPKIRARNSAKNLLAFSALLLFLSVMVSRHVLFGSCGSHICTCCTRNVDSIWKKGRDE